MSLHCKVRAKVIHARKKSANHNQKPAARNNTKKNQLRKFDADDQDDDDNDSFHDAIPDHEDNAVIENEHITHDECIAISSQKSDVTAGNNSSPNHLVPGCLSPTVDSDNLYSAISSMPSQCTNTADFVKHRIMFAPVDHCIIEKMHTNFKLIPESKFEFISDTRIKQYAIERRYKEICGAGNSLWQDFLRCLSPQSPEDSLHYLDHIDWEQVHITGIFTHDNMVIPQRPHIDFTWEVLLLESRRRRGKYAASKSSTLGLKHGFMPYTGHMPLTPDGSYIYVWCGPGPSMLIHIKYGQILFLRGDVVHCGGLPQHVDHANKQYPRLHFYFLTNPADHPGNNIYHDSYDSVSFKNDHYHE
jgi:hypothetical protein